VRSLNRRAQRALLAFVCFAVPATAAAHGFGRLYNLPVPFWLYAWAASAVLVVSFLLAAVLTTANAPAGAPSERDITRAAWVRGLRRLMPLLKLLSVLLLALCLATAFFGNAYPYRNFSMTFFWVVFLLGFTYLTAFIGNLYAVINPWRVIAESIGRFASSYQRGLFYYPKALGDSPALVLYLAFIWLELFGHGKPMPLGWMLLSYSIINLVGAGLVGIRAWFRHCEFFAVYLRLIALISPLDYRPGIDGERSTLHWRLPFAGLLQERPKSLSTIVFVMAMLSTTAFDGLRATQTWVSLFWADPTGVVNVLFGTPPMQDFARMRSWYIGWETLWLFAGAFVYLSIFLGFIWLTKRLARSPLSVRALAFDFAFTLLPIALAYHMTHYATLMLTQGLKILSLVSDPFGWGWDLFGTEALFRAPILPGMGWVWHSQVGLILIGHIISVFLSHRVALRVFPSRGHAFWGQLPMLFLMIALTLFGLWILAQPLTVQRMQ